MGILYCINRTIKMYCVAGTSGLVEKYRYKTNFFFLLIFIRTPVVCCTLIFDTDFGADRKVSKQYTRHEFHDFYELVYAVYRHRKKYLTDFFRLCFAPDV